MNKSERFLPLISALGDLLALLFLLTGNLPAAAGSLAAACVCATGSAVIYGKRFRALEQEAREQEQRAQECIRACGEIEQQARDQVLRFHSTVSHSLRIPISVIQGYADLLLGDLVPDEEMRRSYLIKICERISYMNNTLGQLLLEARLKAELPAAYFQRMDVLDLVRKVSADMSATAEKQGVRIAISTEEENVWISGDTIQLTKAFYNILENSLKYMGRAGTVNIEVSLPGNDRVFIAFRDDGNGMESAETEHVFEANYQGSNKLSGSGMGLNMVAMAVKAHGGTVRAASSPDSGMEIALTLPVSQPGNESEER